MTGPTYLLAATPTTDTRLPNLFSSGRDSLKDLLENPPTFRYAGWDLTTGDQARIVGGECLEVTNGDRKKIQLFEDGTLLAQGAADSSFLAWGPYANEFAARPRLNPLAIIEFTTSFAHLYKKILLLLKPKPSEIAFQLEIRNAAIGGNRLYMTPYGLGTFAWMSHSEIFKLQSDNVEAKLTVSSAVLESDENHVAYLLVERLYLLFGMFTDMIPYTEAENGNRRISTTSFEKK